MKYGLLVLVLVVVVGGCGLRFAPTEVQKQNAYLHAKTSQMAAVLAIQDGSGETLRGLTAASATQAEVGMAYAGLPKELPKTETIEEVLSPESETITNQAHNDAVARPDPWQITDNLLEFGIALAGVVGGVYGVKVTAGLKTAKAKSQALREVIEGNELFKLNADIETKKAFADAQGTAQETITTKQLVAAIKKGA